jgi:hypothetical protein
VQISSSKEDAVTTELKHYPVVESVIDIFAQWLKRRRDYLETCNCEAGELARMAHDIGVSPGDLDELVRRGPHAADELPKMLAALNLDEQAIARSEPFMLRDMERVCAMCEHKRQCDHELAAGTAAGHYKDYCANASSLTALKQTTH